MQAVAAHARECRLGGGQDGADGTPIEVSRGGVGGRRKAGAKLCVYCRPSILILPGADAAADVGAAGRAEATGTDTRIARFELPSYSQFPFPVHRARKRLSWPKPLMRCVVNSYILAQVSKTASAPDPQLNSTRSANSSNSRTQSPRAQPCRPTLSCHSRSAAWARFAGTRDRCGRWRRTARCSSPAPATRRSKSGTRCGRRACARCPVLVVLSTPSL